MRHLGADAPAKPANKTGEAAKQDFVPLVSLALAGSTRPPSPCVLLGIADGQIHLRSEKWIGESARVVVTFEHVVVSGEVLYCTLKDGYYRTCIKMDDEGHGRKEPRFPLDEPCSLTLLEDARSVRIRSQLIDVSQSGLGLRTSVSAAVGSMAYVETRTMLIVGEVRHCRQQGVEFILGMSTSDIISASRAQAARSRLGRLRWRLAEIILGRRIRA